MHLLDKAATVLLAGWFPALGQLLLVLLLGLLAYVPGRGVVDLIWRRRRVSSPATGSAGGPRDGVEDAALSASLGLVLFASGGFLLGLAGVLGAMSFAVLVAAAQVAAYRVWHRIALAVARFRPSHPGGGSAGRGDRGAQWVAGACLSGFLLTLALISLYPPYIYDSTAYHLPYVQGFLAAGGLPVLPDLIYPVFPQLAEILWVPLLPAFGATGAHAVVLLHGLLAAAAAYAWARRMAGRRAGGFAAALWLGCPGVVLYATVAYVDVVLAHFVVAAGLALWVGWSEGWDGRWLATAGVLTGAGVAVKYHGLVFAGLLTVGLSGALVWAWVKPGGRGRARRRRWRAVALCLVLAGAVAAPWYLHIHVATGSPLHPFLGGQDGAEVGSGAAPEPRPAEPRPGGGDAPSSLLHLPALLWEKTVTAALRDGGDVPRLVLKETVPGVRDQGPPHLSIWLLILGPLALLPRLRPPGTGVVLATVGLYAAFWFVTARDPRYLFYPAALLCPLAGVVADRMLTAAGRWRPGVEATLGATLAVALLLAAPGTLYSAFRLTSLGPLPRTSAAEEAFLAQRVPGYPALRWIQQTAGPATVYAVGGTRLHAYATGRLLVPPGWRLPLMGDGEGAAGLARALRREGVEFVVVVPAVIGGGRAGPEAAVTRRLAATPGLTLRSRIDGAAVFAVDLPPGALR